MSPLSIPSLYLESQLHLRTGNYGGQERGEGMEIMEIGGEVQRGGALQAVRKHEEDAAGTGCVAERSTVGSSQGSGSGTEGDDGKIRLKFVVDSDACSPC